MTNPLENLWPPPQHVTLGNRFQTPDVIQWEQLPNIPSCHDDDMLFDIHKKNTVSPMTASWHIVPGSTKPQGYELSIHPQAIRITANDSIGLSYAMQTLHQLLAHFQKWGHWAHVEIADHPNYTQRSVMLDLGRSTFNMPTLKRVVRLLHRLKLNQLHLHLYDDELCGLRFENLPFGSENPFALSLHELSQLIQYAQAHHVQIAPELEGWGHVGSLTYHRPDLDGGSGMYNGSSFLIGSKMFALMHQLVQQVAAILPRQAVIHMGLDEARWYPDPNLPDTFGPSDMIEKYHQMLKEIGQTQDKQFTMRLWADHAGHHVPDHLLDQVIVEPWQYWANRKTDIEEKVHGYSHTPRCRWMAGAGTSLAQHRGSYLATRHWCQTAIDSPNVQGINMTLWGTNDLESRFVSLFAGAGFSWNAHPTLPWADTDDSEDFDRHLFPILHEWRGLYPDVHPQQLIADRGPLVHQGLYLYGPQHGQPVAPTVLRAQTTSGHDFLAEGQNATLES